jgi:hypothetical protein
LSTQKEEARLQRTLVNGPINPVGTICKPTGDYTDTVEETLEVLLSTHFPGCEENDKTLTVKVLALETFGLRQQSRAESCEKDCHFLQNKVGHWKVLVFQIPRGRWYLSGFTAERTR